MKNIRIVVLTLVASLLLTGCFNSDKVETLECDRIVVSESFESGDLYFPATNENINVLYTLKKDKIQTAVYTDVLTLEDDSEKAVESFEEQKESVKTYDDMYKQLDLKGTKYSYSVNKASIKTIMTYDLTAFTEVDKTIANDEVLNFYDKTVTLEELTTYLTDSGYTCK